MNAFAPHDARLASLLLGLVPVTALLGFGLARVRPFGLARVLAWALVLLGLAAVDRATLGEPAGFRMMALITLGLVAMKAPVAVEACAAGAPPLPLLHWVPFALAWFGMDPAPFASRASAPLDGTRALFVKGAVRLALGALLVAAARVAWVETRSVVLATALLLPGISLALHFGVLNLAAASLRALGFDVHELFRAPLLSQNLAEFWGKRWNLAFTQMTSIAVYRPLGAALGRGPATVAAFLFSGLLHEMAISLPPRAGFGLPLLYFTVHGVLVLVERALGRRGRAITGALGRAWTITWVALPIPILFHLHFLRGVVWPLVGIEG